jgi:2-polyprenyl-3-methyl-5-hydroxy-6-metoxy-1,4-benzoquinol methylase
MSWIKRQVILRRFKPVIGKKKGARILEIGCGEGQLLLALRESFPDAELTGLDFQFHPDHKARLDAAGIRILVGLAENVALPESAFDIIVMNQLIEHLWDVDSVLHTCWRALRPGGILTIETPNADGYDRDLFRSGAWGLYYYPRHLNLFSHEGLRRVLERDGFAVTRQTHLLQPLGWIFTMHSLAGRHTHLSWLRKVFKTTNPLAVAAFAIVDLGARMAGMPTSNQKVVASKHRNA